MSKTSASPGPITSTEGLRAELQALSLKTGAQFFKLGVQLPKQGKFETPIVATERMWMSLKTYASGGENTMHAHLNEDHVFVVLQGRAEFRTEEQPTRIIGRYEGVMLPVGAKYCFQAIEDEPLVILRYGAFHDLSVDQFLRVSSSGAELDGFSKESGYTEIVLSDHWFGASAVTETDVHAKR